MTRVMSCRPVSSSSLIVTSSRPSWSCEPAQLCFGESATSSPRWRQGYQFPDATINLLRNNRAWHVPVRSVLEVLHCHRRDLLYDSFQNALHYYEEIHIKMNDRHTFWRVSFFTEFANIGQASKAGRNFGGLITTESKHTGRFGGYEIPPTLPTKRGVRENFGGCIICFWELFCGESLENFKLKFSANRYVSEKLNKAIKYVI